MVAAGRPESTEARPHGRLRAFGDGPRPGAWWPGGLYPKDSPRSTFEQLVLAGGRRLTKESTRAAVQRLHLKREKFAYPQPANAAAKRCPAAVQGTPAHAKCRPQTPLSRNGE